MEKKKVLYLLYQMKSFMIHIALKLSKNNKEEARRVLTGTPLYMKILEEIKNIHVEDIDEGLRRLPLIRIVETNRKMHVLESMNGHITDKPHSLVQAKE